MEISSNAVYNYKEANMFLINGSVAGTLITAMFIRMNPNAEMTFTQTQSVSSVDLKYWKAGRSVGLLEISVDNTHPENTENLVNRIHEAGHKILFIVDQNSRAQWEQFLGSQFNNLAIKPHDKQTQGSSGAYLNKTLPNLDQHSRDLLDGANGAAKGDFTSHFADIVNTALKSDLSNETRRPVLATHLAFDREPNGIIGKWTSQYHEAIARNHASIVENRQDLQGGIFFYDGSKLPHDGTKLMMAEYGNGAKIVVLQTTAFQPGKGNVPIISIGAKELDLLTYFQASNVPMLGGITGKVNFELAHKDAAIEAVRKSI
jgi:hypothetical protein